MKYAPFVSHLHYLSFSAACIGFAQTMRHWRTDAAHLARLQIENSQ